MSQQYQNWDNTDQQTQTMPDMPMKWHKFLIYFSLWAGAVLAVINGFMLLSGAHYGESADRVYAIFGGLKPVDTLCGILMLGVAVGYIVCRFKLAGLQRAGVKMVIALPILMAVFNIAYPFIASAATGISVGDLMDSSSVGSIVGAIALALYNKKYYADREHMLVD